MISKIILVCVLAVSLSSCATREENRALAAGIVLGTVLSQQQDSNTGHNNTTAPHANHGNMSSHESKPEHHESSSEGDSEQEYKKHENKHESDDHEDEHED